MPLSAFAARQNSTSNKQPESLSSDQETLGVRNAKSAGASPSAAIKEISTEENTFSKYKRPPQPDENGFEHLRTSLWDDEGDYNNGDRDSAQLPLASLIPLGAGSVTAPTSGAHTSSGGDTARSTTTVRCLSTFVATENNFNEFSEYLELVLTEGDVWQRCVSPQFK